MTYCPSVVDIIGDDFGSTENIKNLDLFLNLTVLFLHDVLKLKSICQQASPFPSLKRLHIFECPSLRKLPLDCNNAKNSLQKIEVETWWWNCLEWEDEAIEHALSLKLSPFIF